MGLILILSHNTVIDSANCIFALQQAENKKRVLVWDTESPFPANSNIDILPENVRVCFSSTAVPLSKGCTNHCWKKVADKLFDKEGDLKRVLNKSIIGAVLIFLVAIATHLELHQKLFQLEIPHIEHSFWRLGKSLVGTGF